MGSSDGIYFVVVVMVILFVALFACFHYTDMQCQACFDNWNAEHGENIFGAASNEPIFDGEFTLCHNACTTPLYKQLSATKCHVCSKCKPVPGAS
jgi:hypothetical protein